MSATDAAPARRRTGGLLFLPAAWQSAGVLSWLKRVHAWTGLWGALFFLFLGASGILLNHRSVLKIETGERAEVSAVETLVEAPFETPEAFSLYVKERFGVATEPLRGGVKVTTPEAPVLLGGQDVAPAETWEVRYWGPNARLTARYLPAAGLLALDRTPNTLLGTLKELHKGHGVTVFWILLIDAAAGALFFMSVTGTLLWTRLHGPRLAAAGVVGASLALFLAAMSSTFIG